MIRSVIDRINENISYSFEDVKHGVVYPVFHKNMWIPGDRNETGYTDAIPDQARQSILYWEDYGTTVLFNSPRYSRMQTSVRLVLWMNFRKIDIPYEDAINEIMRSIPKRIGNDVHIIRRGQQPKTMEIFSRYSYRDAKQYVAPPYDVLALNFDIRYMSTFC